MYLRAEMKDLTIPKIKLPEGYTIREVKDPISNKDKQAWEQIYGRKWWAEPKKRKRITLFVEYKKIPVATIQAYHIYGSGTLHAATTHPNHRRRGLYRALVSYGLNWLIKQGVSIFLLHANIPIIYNFWKREINLKEVNSDIAPFAKGGKYNFNDAGPVKPPKSKIVSITFDDGYTSCHDIALPLLKKFDCVGTCYVITDMIKLPNHMNVNQLKTLQLNGWEIGGHSHTHRNLVRLDDKELRTEIMTCYNWLKTNGFNPFSFSYPFGKSNAKIRDVVSRHFKSGRLNHNISSDLYKISPYIIEAEGAYFTRIKYITSLLDRFFQNENEEWLVLFFHEIADTGIYSIPKSELEKILRKIRSYNGQILTIKDAIMRVNKK